MNKRVVTIINDKIIQLESSSANTLVKGTNDSFNPKDIEIIRLIGVGMSNRLIAEKLNYSEGTIRNRISAILADTGLTDRTQIALFAIKNRLV